MTIDVLAFLLFDYMEFYPKNQFKSAGLSGIILQDPRDLSKRLGEGLD